MTARSNPQMIAAFNRARRTPVLYDKTRSASKIKAIIGSKTYTLLVSRELLIVIS